MKYTRHSDRTPVATLAELAVRYSTVARYRKTIQEYRAANAADDRLTVVAQVVDRVLGIQDSANFRTMVRTAVNNHVALGQLDHVNIDRFGTDQPYPSSMEAAIADVAARLTAIITDRLLDGADIPDASSGWFQ